MRGDTISSDEANRKLVELQRDNEQLRKENVALKIKRAKGQESYQQHEDKTKIKVLPKKGLFENPFGIETKKEMPIDLNISWDDIFKSIASSFISPIETNLASDVVSQSFCTYNGYKEDYYLDTQTCSSILTQFYALGYLSLQSGEVYLEGAKSFYVLTEFGMQTYVELSAKKKKHRI